MAVDPKYEVKIDIQAAKRYAAILENGNHPAVRKLLKQWGAVYRAFAQKRFNRYSRGGGSWPPLKEATKKRRRKARRGHRGSRSFSILRDTGMLFAALHPVLQQSPGQYEKRRGFSVTVGYGGAGRHRRGKITVADLANIHDRGLGVVPKREIIVKPDVATRSTMTRVAGITLKSLARSTGNA